MGEVTREEKQELDELLSNTFTSIMRLEERSLKNRLTDGLTITEIHTIAAIGLHEEHTMSEVAARLAVTLATLTTTVNKLVSKGFVERERSEQDRRRVMIRLTRPGREVCRAHSLFHRHMIDQALEGLDAEETRVLVSTVTKIKTFFDDMR